MNRCASFQRALAVLITSVPPPSSLFNPSSNCHRHSCRRQIPLISVFLHKKRNSGEEEKIRFFPLLLLGLKRELFLVQCTFFFRGNKTSLFFQMAGRDTRTFTIPWGKKKTAKFKLGKDEKEEKLSLSLSTSGPSKYSVREPNSVITKTFFNFGIQVIQNLSMPNNFFKISMTSFWLQQR